MKVLFALTAAIGTGLPGGAFAHNPIVIKAGS